MLDAVHLLPLAELTVPLLLGHQVYFLDSGRKVQARVHQFFKIGVKHRLGYLQRSWLNYSDRGSRIGLG